MELATDVPLADAGFDSLVAVEFSQAVAAEFAVKLPATLIFDYPTLSAVARFIAPQTIQRQPPQVSTSLAYNKAETSRRQVLRASILQSGDN